MPWGSEANLAVVASICSGVPSKKRPQPPTKSESPVKSEPSCSPPPVTRYEVWPFVWAGVCTHFTSRPPSDKISPSLTLRVIACTSSPPMTSASGTSSLNSLLPPA